MTCTLGEEGEVLVDDLTHLAADQGDELGEHRLGELKRRWTSSASPTSSGSVATAASGTRAWRRAHQGRATARDVLRDGIFWTTDLLEAANELVPLSGTASPQVLITYNEIGGYGHPDHIQAHRVAMYGYLLAGVPNYRPDLGPAWRCSGCCGTP